MNTIALVTDRPSLPIDYDMPLLLEACSNCDLKVEVCEWDDPEVDWSRFAIVLLRSPWDYANRLPEFLSWCQSVSSQTTLLNPLSVVRWNLDKHYLADLSAYGVPIVPSAFFDANTSPEGALQEFFVTHPKAEDIVIKPTIGAYSKNVGRFNREQTADAVDHIVRLQKEGSSLLLQPYLYSIDRYGETDMIYFNGEYSHAIRKEALLMADGTVHVPETEFRSVRIADKEERSVASAALEAVKQHLGLNQPLLYARIDLIRNDSGQPLLLEMEICEPSLSMPFAEESALQFALALRETLEAVTRTKIMNVKSADV